MVSGSATYTVVVTDANGATASANFTLTVSTMVVATASLPSTYTLTQDQPQITPFMPVTGSGGTTPPPLKYAMSTTTPLPMGLSMSSTGMISGIPTVSTPAMSYTVVVTDSNGAAASANFTLTVSTRVTATASTPSTYTLTLNQPSANFMPVTGFGGTGTLKYAMSATTPLPANLSINSSTGMITGIPTISSNATSYTVVVTDSNQATASANFTLTVNSAVMATQKIATESLTQNQPLANFTPVTGSGGTGTLTYTISPPLPGGLTLSPSTGMISGVPTATAPATTYAVTVTDSNNAADAKSFSLTVNTAVTAATSVAAKVLTVGLADPFMPVTGSGGTGTLTYSVSPLPLPAGLTLNPSTGAIAGTPTMASPTTTYMATVTDTNQAKATANFSLTVQDFSLKLQGLPSSGQITVSQGFTNGNDPVLPQLVNLSAISIFGFATAPGSSLTVTCSPGNPAPAGAPTCSAPPPATLAVSSSAGTQPSVPIIVDATNATPGSYLLTVEGSDPTTGLRHIVQFNVYVGSFVSAQSIPSGSTTQASVNFTLPAGMVLPITCTYAVIAPNNTPVPIPSIPIGCTLSASSIGSSGSNTAQSVSVTVTVNTGGTTTAQLATQTTIFAASFLGVPILALIGYFSRGKRPGRSFVRFLAVVFLLAGVLQSIGCGGSFNRTTTVTNTTPAGTYYLLVQGPGSGTTKQPYQAVVQVNVIR
jgi:hypothetical protein